MMLVMPADNTGKAVRELWSRYPDQLAGLMSLRQDRKTAGYVKAIAENITYGVDNGRFIATTKNRPWDESAFYRLLDRVSEAPRRPRWVAVPDVVGSAALTLKMWHTWTQDQRFMDHGFPLAFVVQDGITPGEVPPEADVVFIGGTRPWKMRHLWKFCRSFERVHVGAINSSLDLWKCHNAGAESVDGTGWFRREPERRVGLLQYLHRSSLDLGPRQRRMFGLWEAEATGGKFHPELREKMTGE